MIREPLSNLMTPMRTSSVTADGIHFLHIVNPPEVRLVFTLEAAWIGPKEGVGKGQSLGVSVRGALGGNNH